MTRYILIFVISLLFASCYSEDEVTAERGDNIFVLNDSEEPVQHFLYEFANKYNSIILFDYSDADYQWNMNSTNDFEAEKLDRKPTVAELDYLKKVFLGIYPGKFMKDYFPFKIFLAKSIPHYDDLTYEDIDRAAATGIGFICLGKLNNELPTLTDEQIMAYKGEINASFWMNAVFEKGRMKMPQEFYDISKKYYSRNLAYPDGWSPDVEPNTEKGQEDFGFVWMDTSWGAQFPAKDKDLEKYIEYIFSHTKAEREEYGAKYPLVEQKFNLIIKAISKQCDLDLNEVIK